LCLKQFNGELPHDDALHYQLKYKESIVKIYACKKATNISNIERKNASPNDNSANPTFKDKH
jgi:hypothetical protein